MMKLINFLVLLLSISSQTYALQCPKWLQPVCTSTCVVRNCLSPLFECLKDSVCAANLEKMGPCMGTLKPTDPLYPYKCMTPDNKKRDDFLHCVIQEHKCSPIVRNDTRYPKCEMSSITPNGKIKGDPNFNMKDLKSVLLIDSNIE